MSSSANFEQPESYSRSGAWEFFTEDYLKK
jgi:hypothetical protein